MVIIFWKHWNVPHGNIPTLEVTTVSCLVATHMTGRIINISSAEGSSVTTGHPHCCQWNNEANCRHSQLKMEPDTAAECTIHKIWGQEEVWRSILYYWWPVNTRPTRFSQFMCRLPKCHTFHRRSPLSHHLFTVSYYIFGFHFWFVTVRTVTN